MTSLQHNPNHSNPMSSTETKKGVPEIVQALLVFLVLAIPVGGFFLVSNGGDLGLLSSEPSVEDVAEQAAIDRISGSCRGVTFDAEAYDMHTDISGQRATVRGGLHVVYTSGGRKGEGPFNDAYFGNRGRTAPFTCHLLKHNGKWRARSVSWSH